MLLYINTSLARKRRAERYHAILIEYPSVEGFLLGVEFVSYHDKHLALILELKLPEITSGEPRHMYLSASTNFEPMGISLFSVKYQAPITLGYPKTVNN